jgi:hypothetical protein
MDPDPVFAVSYAVTSPSSLKLRRGKQVRGRRLSTAFSWPLVAGKPGRRGAFRGIAGRDTADRSYFTTCPRHLALQTEARTTCDPAPPGRRSGTQFPTLESPASSLPPSHTDIRSAFEREIECRMPRPGQVLFCSTFLDQQKSGTWFYRIHNDLHTKGRTWTPIWTRPPGQRETSSKT